MTALIFVLAIGLSGMLLINVLPSYAAGNPYISPVLSFSPNTGPTGTVTTATGSGFSPGVTVTLADPDGTFTVAGGTITTDSSGHFTASVTIVSGSAAQHFTATGSDIGTNPKDTAKAVFTITNVNASHSTEVRNNGGSADVNDTTITGVNVGISGLGSFTGTLDVTTTSLTGPGNNIQAVGGGGTMYFDVSVTATGGTPPAGATATICYTNPGVTSTDTLNYWDGTAWVSATNVTIHGSRVCGDVPLSALTGTNLAVYIPAGASAGFDYITWGSVAVVVAVVVIGLAFFYRKSRK